MKRCVNMILAVAFVLAFLAIGQGTALAGRGPSLYEAALSGNAEQVKDLAGRAADIDSPDADGQTPLACAIRGGSVEAVAAILEAGADANRASREGLPLFLAAREGRADMIVLLLSSQADPAGKDASGTTALHGAAISGNVAVAELLLSQGADRTARNASGLTAEALAQVTQRTDIVRLLQAPVQAGPGRGAEPGAGRGRPGEETGQRAFPGRERGRGMRNMRPGGEMPAASAAPAARTAPTVEVAPVALTVAQVLEDPNAIRAKIAAFAGLAEALAGQDSNSLTEQRLWRRQTSDNRTTVLRSATTQFAAEMDMVRALAQKEKAATTVQAIDDLMAAREQRNDAISEMLREQRRAERAAERESDSERTTRTRGNTTARSRGRTDTAAEPAMPARRANAREEADGPQLDPETQRLVDAWEGASLDKRSLLDSVLEVDLDDLNGLREAAAAENADETTAALEGLMLARQVRRDTILDEIAADEEREARREEREASQNNTTTGAGRSTTGSGRRTR